MYLQFTEEVQVVESVGLNLTDVVHTEIPKSRRKEKETERSMAMTIISVSPSEIKKHTLRNIIDVEICKIRPNKGK